MPLVDSATGNDAGVSIPDWTGRGEGCLGRVDAEGNNSGTCILQTSHGTRKYLGSTNGAVTSDRVVAMSHTSTKLTCTVSGPTRPLDTAITLPLRGGVVPPRMQIAR